MKPMVPIKHQSTRWFFTQHGKLPKLTKPILIEGLPGIGNVGKVAVDFIIEELKAVKIYDIFSYTFPHSVFVNEQNMVELPSIEMYYKKYDGKRSDLLLLAGDIQPVDEVASYEFCDGILDIFEQFKGQEVITLGGIGLHQVGVVPKVYTTGNSKDIIKRYASDTGMIDKLYGVVGPIVGASGLLLGLAQRRNIPAVTLLAETIAHPMYLGIKGAREISKVLDKKLQLKLSIRKLDREINELEREMLKTTKELTNVQKQTALRKFKVREQDYIG